VAVCQHASGCYPIAAFAVSTDGQLRKSARGDRISCAPIEPGNARCYAQGMPRHELPPARRSPATRVTLLILLVVLLFGTRSFAAYAIEIEWWKELGQLKTWFSMLYYSIAPIAAATLLAFGALWIAHARALPEIAPFCRLARPHVRGAVAR